MSMTCYWSYHPRYWRGLEQHGFLKGNVGVRFVHTVWAESNDTLTNKQLALDSELTQFILSQGLGLVIDRGCGGIEYRPYAFDGELLAFFQQKLGDKFLGIQMHEWYSNMVNDLGRIREAGGSEELHRKSLESPKDLLNNHLEYGTSGDYCGRAFPLTVEEFQSEADHHFHRKARDFFGCYYVTDSYYQSYWRAFQNGARHAMAEIGGQTALTRLQIASVRGAARAHGKSWGVYYEQWGCPLSVLWHNRDASFWQVPAEIRDQPYFTHGARGGSSRALQKRILYYAALAGAQTLVEEWGGENTFSDWESFPLTDYGRIMKEFFLFVNSVNVGEPLTNIAIMLDPSDGPLDHEYIDGRYETIVRYFEPTPNQKRIKERLREIYETPEDAFRYGEPHTLTAGLLPDVFDVVYSDIAPAALLEYNAIYYLGAKQDFARARHLSFPGTWIEGFQADSIKLLETLVREHSPVWATGPVAWTINTVPEGYIVGLFNNRGVQRSVEQDEHIDSTENCVVELQFKEIGSIECLNAPNSEQISAASTQHTISIPAGDCRIIRFSKSAAIGC